MSGAENLEDDVKVLRDWIKAGRTTGVVAVAVNNIIKEIERRDRHLRMRKAAEKYYKALEVWNIDTSNDEAQEALKTAEDILNEESAEFSDDPAFMAFLKLERERAKNPPREIRALRAIRARIDGAWDDPDLMEVGPLFINPVEDIRRILDHLKGKKNHG